MNKTKKKDGHYYSHGYNTALCGKKTFNFFPNRSGWKARYKKDMCLKCYTVFHNIQKMPRSLKLGHGDFIELVPQTHNGMKKLLAWGSTYCSENNSERVGLKDIKRLKDWSEQLYNWAKSRKIPTKRN